MGGVPGLCKQVRGSQSASWILRVKIGSRTRELGIGSCRSVSLKEARTAARDLRTIIAEGVDPIAQKRTAELEARRKQLRTRTFSQVASLYIDAVSDQWKSKKSRSQWISSLENYVFPVIGEMNCEDIGIDDLRSVLEPIWKTKTETASRVRGRIERILAYARTSGYRSGENPARYKGYLDSILPSPEKLKKINSHPALHYEELPYFLRILREVKSTAAYCLEFMVLTATRQGETRGMVWAEIDLENQLWTIPSERMKANKEHTVPLTRRCMEILWELEQQPKSKYVFSAIRGGMISDATIGKLVKSLHEKELQENRVGFIDSSQKGRVVVPHGFRSTFRDWAAERTSYPREVIEHCLAHRLRDRVEAAYQRGSILPKRWQLMQTFDAFCSGSVIEPKLADIHKLGSFKPLSGESFFHKTKEEG